MQTSTIGKLKVKEKTPTGYMLENGVEIEDTFAEMFRMWAARILITADSEKWATTAAETAVGLATSVIMSPAEAGIEAALTPDSTPDKRMGMLIQIYNRDRFDLKHQMILRIGQCIMTCPTTAAYDAMPNPKRKLKVGRSLRLFGDGFQRKSIVNDSKVWKIPVMEGDFIVEDLFGVTEAIAGGNFLIMAKNQHSALKAAEEAVKTIKTNKLPVILPFPGGICRAGSKAGSLKYKLRASTNHPYCPKLKTVVEDTQLPKNVECVYEIVIDGLTQESVQKAMNDGIVAAVTVPDIVKISAGNYGGKIGPYKAYLRETLAPA
jgi:formylmethanofuran--tetrahydromethanopterin N-formyltransferase